MPVPAPYLPTFLKQNRALLSKASDAKVVITYCAKEEYLEILRLIEDLPFEFANCRILHEMQLVAFSFATTADVVYGLEYEDKYCEADFGGGVVEILQSGFANEKEAYTPGAVVKRLDQKDVFTHLRHGATLQLNILQNRVGQDLVLLPALPFEIKGEIWINGRYRDGFTLLAKHNSIPCKKSETVTDGNCTIILSLLGQRYLLDVYELFHHYTDNLRITVDVDHNSRIVFTLKDNKADTVEVKSLPLTKLQSM